MPAIRSALRWVLRWLESPGGPLPVKVGISDTLITRVDIDDGFVTDVSITTRLITNVTIADDP